MVRFMKCFYKIVAVILCFVLGEIPVSAENGSAATFSVINLNVAGLPKWITGNDSQSNQNEIGKQLTVGGYDIIAVQEDFGYHSNLTDNISGYSYTTNHSGGVPAGDGLNLFSKYPIYNETRIPWNQTYGILTDGSDELTPKGILYAVIELEPGVYLDFYDIHADAYDDAGSRAARENNFKQLAELIVENSSRNDRPIIVTGDFNTYSHLDNSQNSNFCQYFYEQLGFKNAWTEICNGGDYEDYSKWSGDNWGKWDSVEMFLYKSSQGVELSVTDFAYKFFTDENGVQLSDHAAAIAVFTYAKTAEFSEKSQNLQVVKAQPVKLFVRYIANIFTDLMKIFQIPKFI